MENESLNIKVSKGTAWSFIGSASSSAIHFIVLTVLTRLLDANSFGLFALALVVTQLFSEIGEFGIQAGLVRSNKLLDLQLSSCFFLNLLLLGTISIFIFIFAPILAPVLGLKEVGNIIKILGIILVFDAASTVPLALLIRDMRFREIALVEVSTNFSYAIVTVLLAANNVGVMSLVYGAIFQRFFKAILIFLFSGYRPKLSFKLSSIKTILAFGLNLSGERLINFFAQRADYFLIGKLLGTMPLGYYSLASEISTTPQNRFSSIISRVAYPAYSKIQNDNAHLGKAYLKVVRYVASITFPPLLALAAVAHEFISTVFGEKWLPMVPLLRILCILGCLKSIGYLVGSLLNAKGRSDIGFKWSFIMLSGTIGGVMIGIHWGIIGAATGYAISFVLLLPIIQAIALKLVNLNLIDYVRSLISVLVASTLAGTFSYLVIFIIRRYFLATALLSLCWAIVLGASVYLIAYYIIKKSELVEIWNLRKTIFKGTVKA